LYYIPKTYLKRSWRIPEWIDAEEEISENEIQLLGTNSTLLVGISSMA
jgi:hypothetical protein